MMDNKTIFHLRSNPSTFNPTKLDVKNWIKSIKDLGAKHAIITVKHGCGFLLWPTDVRLPNGWPYGYDVAHTISGRNVLKEFVDGMKEEGLGYGFYYSLSNNFYLNVYHHAAHASANVLPGQHNVSLSEFESISLQHLKELWSNYGNLTEIWFDGGYTMNMKPAIQKLVNKYQPNAAIFNGYGVSKSPLCWVGTESGKPKSEGLWSTGRHAGTGDKYGPVFCPKICDTTLQIKDKWFYTPNSPIRSLKSLIDVYHETVGKNGVLELDFAIDRDGLVNTNHAKRYKELGTWIKHCYSDPVSTSIGFPGQNHLILRITRDVPIDRLMLQEDMTNGQTIRSFEVYELSNGSRGWNKIYESSSGIGNKRIILLKSVINPSKLKLVISKAAISRFGSLKFMAFDATKCEL